MIPIIPKKPDGKLRVLIIARVSTEHQGLENLKASIAFVKKYLEQHYQGPTEIRSLAERCSGTYAGRMPPARRTARR